MSNGPLFNAKHLTVRAEREDATFSTPLGTLRFFAELDGEALPVLVSSATDTGVELRRFAHRRLTLECLRLPVVPPTARYLPIDECVVIVWRARMRDDLASLTFKGEWMEGARNEDGAYDNGEALTSMMWEDEDVQVSLGTLDEDYMSAVALKGWLPRRLAPVYDCAFTDEASLYSRFWPQAIGRVDGLQIPLPPLLKGESVQVHMVAAWHRGEYDTSTWYAVEIDRKIIEWLVEEALRDGAPIDARSNPFQAPDPETP